MYFLHYLLLSLMNLTTIMAIFFHDLPLNTNVMVAWFWVVTIVNAGNVLKLGVHENGMGAWLDSGDMLFVKAIA